MSWSPEEKIPVALLGATGLVGQLIATRLLDHPWFELVQVAASDRSAGKTLGEAARGGGTLDARLAQRVLVPADPAHIDAPIVFSALDAETASTVEPRLAAAGAWVVSNASAFRMDPEVPLVVPEVNGDVLGTGNLELGTVTGGIVCNPNCVAAIVSLPLAALAARWTLRAVSITTLQSVSGAGHPGVPSLDILGNVIPWIAGEEEKIEAELGKLLGLAHGRTGAQAHRVPVQTGHMASVLVGFEEEVRVEDAIAQLRSWRGCAPALPSLPERPIIVTEAPDRPQPRLDEGAGNGMSVTVGRVRADPVLGLRFVVCGSNLVRGAAGAAIANAELLVRPPP